MSRARFEYPENEDAFEDVITDLLEAHFRPPLPAKRFGRRGQRQDGIDIAWFSASGDHQAAQCKFYPNTKLTAADIDRDLAAAHRIEPQLRSLTFVTTNSRNRNLTDHANVCTLHGRSGAVDVWFWEDVEQLLERHGLILKLIGPLLQRHMPDFLRENQLALVPAGALGLQPVSSNRQSELGEEASALLGAGRLSDVIARLTAPHVILDEDLRLTLARAYFQRGDYDEVLALAIDPVAPRLRALVAFVLANQGKVAESLAAIARAQLDAQPVDMAYVTAMQLSAMRVRDRADYETLNDSVPATLRDHPLIHSVLGDSAHREGRDEAAMAHYDAALDADPRPNVLRRMALMAARLSKLSAQLPHADVAFGDVSRVEEMSALRDELRAEDRDELDPAIRSVLLHNLGIASMMLGDGSGSVEYARRAVLLDATNDTFWTRYGFSLSVFGLAIDPKLKAGAPTENPHVQLMLADLEYRHGERTPALERIDSALSLPNVAGDLVARLEALRLVVLSPDELEEEHFRALLTHAAAATFPGPFFIRALGRREFPEGLAELLLQTVDQADFSKTPEDERVALAGMLVERNLPLGATRFLPDLRRLSRLRDGTHDPSVTGVLLRSLLALRRLNEAETLSGEWCESFTDDHYARWLRTRVLQAMGKSDLALNELLNLPAVLASSAVLLAQTVALARASGRLHQARRLVRTLDLPTPQDSNARRALWFALSTVKDRHRLEDLALASLQPGADLGPIAAELLHLTATMRSTGPTKTVRMNCAITVTHPQQGSLRYWIGESPPPIPGLARADWLDIFIGLEAGEQATPSFGPFAGVPLVLTAVRPPFALFHEHAQSLGQAEGDVRGYNGSPEDLVGHIHDEVRASQAFTQRRLELGARMEIPAVLMATLLNRSPRVFLQARDSWIPRCHTGNPAEIEREDQYLSSVEEWIIDGTTVCLVVQAELEQAFEEMNTRLLITQETRDQLRSWYIREREDVRALGMVTIGPGKRLRLQSFDAKSRKDHRAFWVRVASFVNSIPVADRADDDAEQELAPHEDVLDSATLSSLATAKTRRCGLLTDELAVRQAFCQPLEVPSVSLRPLMMRWFQANFSPPRRRALRQVRAFARLAVHGRSFQSIPVASPFLSLYARPCERWKLLQALMPAVRNSDPRNWSAGLQLISYNYLLRRSSRHAGVNSNRLIRLILRNLPPLPRHQYASVATYLEANWKVVDRSTRRAVVRWLRCRSMDPMS